MSTARHNGWTKSTCLADGVRERPRRGKGHRSGSESERGKRLQVHRGPDQSAVGRGGVYIGADRTASVGQAL